MNIFEFARTYSVRDMHFFNLRTPDDLALIKGCGFALDTGHAHINHCLPGFLQAGFSHMHIHDNNGKKIPIVPWEKETSILSR